MRTRWRGSRRKASHRGRGDGPGYGYGWRSHGHYKLLYRVSGSFVFRANKEDFLLEPGAVHAAAVGPDGVESMEAPG